MLAGFRGSLALIVLLVVAAVVLIALGLYVLLRVRKNPKDKEKRRRLNVYLHGRLADATVTEVREDVIFFEYSVRGVVYTASQDISQLRELIPADPERLIGPATLKYSPRNPADSIIVCEEWSGLRIASPSKS